jgi:zinc transporter 9
MHTMQEQAMQLQESGQKSTYKDVAATVFGMVLPLATQIGHHHHH